MRSIRKKKSNLYFSQTTLYPSKLVNQITFRLHRWKFNYFHRASSKKGKKKREKRKKERGKKKEGEIFSHVTQPCRTVESKVSRATRFPYRDTGMKHKPLSSHVIFRFHLAGLQTGAYCVSWILFSDTREIAWPEMAAG